MLLENNLKQSPAELLETPKLSRKLPVFLSVQEIDSMVSCIDRSTAEGERNLCILKRFTVVDCVSELVNLKITDLHLENDYLKVTGKGNKERLVPIGKSAKKLVKNYLNSVRVHVPVKNGGGYCVFKSSWW